ncbi:hypothetical protein [Methylocapsa palsarum]|uniref:MetA-pathway of phenol degradation n=1 Tax=Methylocapsa palsarum TaxID=1612308 RepID=A0A1I3WQX8_9HYPH|nr:hypothetical protein [Methylocapsa palsarum]SFK08886.1 hypothetical protein SAMN05444581_1025 [Methylocapsa palsarum]
MSRHLTLRFAGAVSAIALLAGVSPTLAHTIVGNRLFPATLTVDDPGVNDELTLPSFAFSQSANFDGSLASMNYNVGWEYAKTITADLGISVGSEGYNWAKIYNPGQPNSYAQGWSNIETQLKYVFYQNPEHEFIIAGAISAEWGHTGTVNSSIAADAYTAITPKLYVGKGFGDSSIDWVRPFAVTGEIDYTFSTHPNDYSLQIDDSGNPFIALDQTPTVLTYGFTVQYSLLYMNSFVKEVPEIFSRLIPTFEGVFNTPVSNIGPSVSGNWPPNHVTTGTVGPGVYYIGNYFQIGVTTQFPINLASGKHVGVLANLDLFLDDIFPDTIGKPLFGPPQPRGLQQTVTSAMSH